MFIRNVSLVACLCILASVAASGATNQGTGYVFELPGANSAGSRFQGFIYDANPLNAVIDSNGPAGMRQIIAVPDGSQFYVLGNNGGLQSFDPTFTKATAINGITGKICAASISPNGKTLLVGASSVCDGQTTGTLYVVDTGTNTVLANSIPTTGAIIGFAFTPDSASAYVLTNSAFGSSVSAINLNNRTRTALLNLPYGGSNTITFSPQGLLYVTTQNRIFEINTNAPNTLGSNGLYAACDNSFAEAPPLCVTPTGQIGVVGIPAGLRFTPSGSVAYFANTDPTSAQTLARFTVATHAVQSWPPFASGITPPAFSDVLVASENLIFALTPGDTTIWDVAPPSATLSATPSTVLAGALPNNGVNSVISAVLSNELPSARFLYALVGNGNQANLVRINLATKTADAQTLAILGGGVLQFVIVPPETGAVGFLPFNNNQTLSVAQLTAGATFLPLTAIVTDATGRPIYNLPVTFAVDAGTGVTIKGGAQTTNANGYVSATAVVPAVPGTYTVTLTAGTATTTFTLNVPGATTGGGGGNPSGGPTQVFIVSGNGELIQQGSPLFGDPLTIQVVDTKGTPLPNVPVSFTITGPAIGGLDFPSTVTDMNGIAYTDFNSPQVQQGLPSQSTTVVASTPVGSVTFYVTVYQLNQDGTGEPSIVLNAPASRTITAGAGDVVPNAVQATIYTTAGGQSLPVPNVGIRLLNADDVSAPPASCQTGSLSDNLGVANCTVIVSCSAPLGPQGINIRVGENIEFPSILVVTKGSTPTINIANGNNQSGQAGSTLALPLAATVTDNCGNPISGTAVTWKVTQGTATLSSTTSSSLGGGQVSTKVTLGQTPGSVQVTASLANGSQVVFTLTNQVTVAGISLVSGGGQTVLINQTFPNPLIFQVSDASGKGIPNITVNFSVASGSAGTSPTSANTNASGQVSTTVTAGSTPSTVTITATYATFTSSATLTVKGAGPSVTAASFVNAATVGAFGAQPGLVPCGLGTVTGAGLASAISGVILGNPLGIGPLPFALGGLSMFVNGVPVPIQSISNLNGVQQVNFQTPCETSPGTATVVISVNGTSSTIPGVPVLAVQPGIFNYAGPSGQPYGFVISATDGSYVTPSNPAHRVGSCANPTPSCGTYYLVVTGLGQTTPPIITDAAGTGTQTIPLSQVVVGLDNLGVPVTLAQYATGEIGVYVIGFTIPANAPTGTNQPLAVRINGVFGNSVLLPGVI